MKHLLNLFKSGLLALLPLLFKAKLVAGAGGVLSVVFPALAGILTGNPLEVAGTVLYWLELVVRAVPTASSYTPLTLLISILQAIVPNQAKSADGAPAVHVETSIFKRIFHRAPEAVLPAEVSPDVDPTPAPVTAPAGPTLADLQAQVAQLAAALTPSTPVTAPAYGVAR